MGGRIFLILIFLHVVLLVDFPVALADGRFRKSYLFIPDFFPRLLCPPHQWMALHFLYIFEGLGWLEGFRWFSLVVF